MKLQSRCPHCGQTERIGAGTDTQSAHPCPSCGVAYVPQRHLFVGDERTEWAHASRADPVLPAPILATPQRDSPASTSTRSTWVWAGLSVGLALLLGGQIAIHQRQLWAAQWPEVRPLLNTLCQLLDCQLSAPEMIDAVAVVSSGFDQSQEGDFVFSLQLRQDQTHEVATPSLELTLTDAQERAVIRKILTPAQLGLPQALPAATALSTETRFSLDPELQSHVHGFRVELFYP